jgi:hypothetical protein
MKAECISLVCRMVKVFFPLSCAAAGRARRRIVAPTATEAAKTSRRDGVSLDMGATVFPPSHGVAGCMDVVFIMS